MSDTVNSARNPQNDADWSDLAGLFAIREGTTYLNHGSFGISPDSVRESRRQWIDRLDQQPMDFYVREMEKRVDQSRAKLSGFVETAAENLVLVENSTCGMNIVADSFPLEPGDEVLLTDHEYGAVRRIWNRRCGRTGATEVVAELPKVFESVATTVEAIFDRVSTKTKLIVCSHITSPTALLLPIKAIVAEANRRGITTIVDGPHAPAHVELAIDSLGCDFYTASCHKWLCSTLGSGFLYVNPRWHETIEPPIKSWGRLLPAMPERWYDEFCWSGTRDPSAYLSISAAIEFMQDRVGLDDFRHRSYYLANYARCQMSQLFGTESLAPQDTHGQTETVSTEGTHQWYGTMAHVRLPFGNWKDLQDLLWRMYAIEVPIIEFDDQWFVRVSCHLYNDHRQIDYLVDALKRLTR